jgi:hypothetical protein
MSSSGSWKHSSLLFEKLGLIKRKLTDNRPYSQWKDCTIGDSLKMSSKLRTMTEVFKEKRPTGLLEYYFEPSEMDMIIVKLMSSLEIEIDNEES